MLIHPGTQERVVTETTTGSGSTIREGSIQSDSLLVTLWAQSVTSGSLSVSVFTLTDEGREKEIITFPALVAPTTELLLRKSAVSLQRFRIVATYSGICEYEIYVRAIEGAGESSSKIAGAGSWSVSQTNVTTVAGVLIASTLTDRAGVLVKNWGTTGTIFIAESLIKADAAIGYPLAAKDALALDISAGTAVYAVADTGPIDVRIVQAGG